ncbi:hypothetical protein [Vibrio phage BONAISHI]|nr:hypothetical protein [Vibrio phage BONAISHI]
MAEYTVVDLAAAKSQNANDGDLIKVESNNNVYVVRSPLDAPSKGIVNDAGKVLVWNSNHTIEDSFEEIDAVKNSSSGLAPWSDSETYDTGDVVYHQNRVLECNADGITGNFNSDNWNVLVGPVYGANGNRFTGVKSIIVEFEQFPSGDSGSYFGIKYLELRDYNGTLVNPSAVSSSSTSHDMHNNTNYYPEAIMLSSMHQDGSTERALWVSGVAGENRKTTRICFVLSSPIDIHTMKIRTSTSAGQCPAKVRVYGSAINPRSAGLVDFIREPWLKLMGGYDFIDNDTPASNTEIDLVMESGVNSLPRYRSREVDVWSMHKTDSPNRGGGDHIMASSVGYLERGKKIAAAFWLTSHGRNGDLSSFSMMNDTNADGTYETVYGALQSGLEPTADYRFLTSGITPGSVNVNSNMGRVLDLRDKNIIVPNFDVYGLISHQDHNGTFSNNSAYGPDATHNTIPGHQDASYYSNQDDWVQGVSRATTNSFGTSAFISFLYED